MFEVPKKTEDFVAPALVLLVFLLLIRRRSEHATPPDGVRERGRRAPRSRNRVAAGAIDDGHSNQGDAGRVDVYEAVEEVEDFAEEAGPYHGGSLQPVFEEAFEGAAIPGGVYRASSERPAKVPHRLMPTRGVSEGIEGRRAPPPALARSWTVPAIVGGVAATAMAVSRARRSTPSVPAPQPATSRTLSRAARTHCKQPDREDDGSDDGEDLVDNGDDKDNVVTDDSDEDGDGGDDGHLPFPAVPMASRLPPRSASARARTSSTAELQGEHLVPLSTPLPPKAPRSSRATSATGSRASSAAPRFGTATPSGIILPTPPSTNRQYRAAGDSASATIARSQSVASSALTDLSRSSSPLSPPPDEASKRFVRKSTSRTVQGGEAGDGQVGRNIVTAWFKSESDTLLDSPPDLSNHPDLRPGDLFYNRTSADYQLWIWEAGDNGILLWVPVKFMSVRNGLTLTLTAASQNPSWVSEKHADSRRRDLLRNGYVV